MSSYGKKVFGVACGLTASNWIAFALILAAYFKKKAEFVPPVDNPDAGYGFSWGYVAVCACAIG